MKSARIEIVTLDERGETALLKKIDINGKETSLLLTLEDVLQLRRSLSPFATQILRMSEGPEAPLPHELALQSSQAYVNASLEGGRVILGLLDDAGEWISFALLPELARDIAALLKQEADKISTKPTSH